MNKINIDIEKNKEIQCNELKNNKFNIRENSKLIIYTDKSSFNDYEFNLEDNAYLEINKLYKIGEFQENVTINLNGVNSKVIYNFSTLVNKDQKYIININHNNINTISNVINHGVVLNNSKLTFEVNSKVNKGNIRSILNQESKIITIGENNSIIKPNMYIYEYNIDARHAATIGRFSKDDIFYLMIKGIDYKNANELLIKGFLEGHIKVGGDTVEYKE